MEELISTRPFVMAIDPWCQGFGFAFFEGEHSLIEWGVCRYHLNNRNEKSLARLKTMLRKYQPDFLILEPWETPDCRRGKRVRKFLAAAAKLAMGMGIKVLYISHRDVVISFAQSAVEPSKQVIAKTLALIYPELELRLPPRRKIHMAEDPRMSIYDACALAVAYYRSYASAKATKINNLILHK